MQYNFFYESKEMPTLILCALFHHDRGWKMNLVLVGAVNIYFVNVRSNVISARNYINNYFIVINLL